MAALLSCPQRAYAGDAELQARLGILGAESGALSRSPMVELLVGGRWFVAPGVGAALSYRGGAKAAGGGGVSMVSTVHRVQLGAQLEHRGDRLLLGAELGGHYRAETSQLKAGGVSDPLRTRHGFGVGVDLWSGLRLTSKLWGQFALSGYQRDRRVDLVAALGVFWGLP